MVGAILSICAVDLSGLVWVDFLVPAAVVAVAAVAVAVVAGVAFSPFPARRALTRRSGGCLSPVTMGVGLVMDGIPPATPSLLLRVLILVLFNPTLSNPGPAPMNSPLLVVTMDANGETVAAMAVGAMTSGVEWGWGWADVVNCGCGCG